MIILRHCMSIALAVFVLVAASCPQVTLSSVPTELIGP